MKKKLFILELILTVGGILLTAAGANMSYPILISLGLLITSAGICIGGIDTIIKRRISFSGEDSSTYSSYKGISAVCYGLFFMLLGIGLFVYAIAYTLHLENALLLFIKDHPGVVILGGGFGLFVAGFPAVLGSNEDRRSFLRVVGSIPKRVFGVLLIIVGLAGMVLGVMELMMPLTYESIIQPVKELFSGFPQ